MAGILQYALSLKTSTFDKPLQQSERALKKFEGTSAGTGSMLGGLSMAAAGAGSAFAAFAAATAAAKAVLEGYAEFDGIKRGLETIEGSAAATETRLKTLREVAKVPGLGFEEAVRGDIKLRAVGMSAELSEKAMRAFGNALATVGGGKAELDGVLTALTQIQAKGKVSAEEINQISERVPQVRAAMAAAFGTADTEALQKSAISTTQFIEGLVAELGKLPRVTEGARNILDNYSDSWKDLKNTASEFAVTIAGDWINTVSGAFKTAQKDLRAFQRFLGIAPVTDDAGQAAALKKYQEAKAAKAAEAAALANAEVDAANDAIQREEKAREAADQKKRDRAAEQKALQIQHDKEVAAAREKLAKAYLSSEDDLKRRIALTKAEGPTGGEAIKANRGGMFEADIIERTARLLSLEKELADLRAASSEKAAAAAKRDEVALKAAEAKAAAKAKELKAQQQASDIFNAEGAILEAKAKGQTKLVETLERQAKVEQLKLDIMREQGLAETSAREAAEKRVALEERAAKPRRGLLDAAASAASRLARRSSADVARDARLGRDGNSQTDRLALARIKDPTRGRLINPDRAAAALGRGNGNADPGRVRREEKAEAARKAADPMYRVVKSIEEKFANIASA